MNDETRNVRVVVALILAMTAGARLLLWLEPGGREPSAVQPLLAAGGVPVDEVNIEYCPPDQVPEPGWDCLILPNGECEWAAQGSEIRLVLAGSDGAGLSAAQQEALLAALGSMTLGRGGELVRVRLREEPGPSGAAAEPLAALRSLLVSKRIIE